MEEQSSNWNQGMGTNNPQYMQDLPKAKGTLVLGIVSLSVTVVCCFCYGSFFGFVLSLIGLLVGRSAMNTYHENPEAYSHSSYKKARIGNLLNIIALILSIIISTLLVILIYKGLNGELPPEFQQRWDEEMAKYDYD